MPSGLLQTDGSEAPLMYNRILQDVSATTYGLPNYPDHPTPGSSVAGVAVSYRTYWKFAGVDARTKHLVICSGLYLLNHHWRCARQSLL